MPQRVLFILLLAFPVLAQTSTNFTGTIVSAGSQATTNFNRTFLGIGTVGSQGKAVVSLTLVQASMSADYSTSVGPMTGLVTMVFNSLDQIAVGFGGVPIQDPNFTTVTTSGSINTNNTKGIYAGATAPGGSFSVTLTRTSTSPLSYNVSLTGSATVGSQSIPLTVTNAPVTFAFPLANVFDTDPGTCNFPGIATNGTLSLRSHPDTNKWDDNVHFIELSATCTFGSDILRSFLINTVVDGPNEVFQFGPVTFTGGTGRFAGAGGTAQVANFNDATGTVTITGTLIEAGPTTPIITSVTTPYWVSNSIISQNGWVQIKGSNLVPANTPAGGTFWNDAPEFTQGRMPTTLGPISVTINGKPGYVYWFCSKLTTPACTEDQINVLAPLDDYLGQVLVVVKNGNQTSGAFQATKNNTTPSFLRFDLKGNAVATHLDYSLLGPTTLYPGASTPGRPGEIITLWTVGFGLPTATLVQGSSSQFGTLLALPVCYVDGTQVVVGAYLVSPGLYQLNVTLPSGLSPGDKLLYCKDGGNWTLAALIAVQ